MTEKIWESYEQVAAFLLNAFAADFGLGKVEGKQLVAGKSGTQWEIDAKGVSDGGAGFVIVECKRRTTSRVNQEIIAGLAYRITDTGAGGGIIVTPIGYQEGATKVAAHTGIHTVTLNQDCTKTKYILAFLNKTCTGMHETLIVKDFVTITSIDKDGNVINITNSSY